MIGGNLRAVDVPGLAAGDFVKFASRAHHGHIDRKIWAGELGFKNLLQAMWTQIFGLKAVKMKTILGLEKGTEKRNALNVIPVVVRDQDVGFNAEAALIGSEQVAQAANSSAAIENERSAVGRGEFEAGSIAPIAPGVALDGGRRATHAPKHQFGNLLRHGWAREALPEKAPREGEGTKLMSW